jgi:hypothetical protein
MTNLCKGRDAKISLTGDSINYLFIYSKQNLSEFMQISETVPNGTILRHNTELHYKDDVRIGWNRKFMKIPNSGVTVFPNIEIVKTTKQKIASIPSTLPRVNKLIY